jgi:isoquinoline 1-oxidoreductase beta subunit
LIGTPIKRRDSLEKVNGRAVFGIDVQLPGMLVASVLRCPSYEGRVSRVDDSDARKIPGVRQVLTLDPIPTSLPGRVAVIADSTWSAMQGRKALKVEWDLGPNADFNTDTLWATAREWVHQDSRAVPVKNDDGAGPPPRDSRLLEASYEVPFAAHACMEPMNCTADIQADRAEVWAPTQAPLGARASTAKLTGLPEDRVTIHVTYLGGGFGRRYYDDFVVEAVEISKRMGTPVKVMWTREEDIQHDIYRPAVLERFGAALDGSGLPIRWHNRVVAPSWRRWWHPGADKPERSDEADLPPYNISNIATDYIELPRAVPIGAWRSVKHSQNGFCLESFIDECAHAAGRDPLEYRIALLEGKPRQQAVLQLAARKAGWGTALSQPRGRGVAFWNYAGTYVAEIAEVTLDSSQQVHVDRVVCAFDCGTVVNPDTVRAQIESAVGWGVSAALWGEVTVQGGHTRQSNFHDYRVLRINECPRIEIELVRNFEPPTGVGEPAVPPLAAAIANAVFAASGVRRRRLPLNAR